MNPPNAGSIPIHRRRVLVGGVSLVAATITSACTNSTARVSGGMAPVMASDAGRSGDVQDGA